MPKYCYYDPAEKVIFADYSRQALTPEMLAEVRGELAEITKKYPHKVYTVTNYEATKIGPSLTTDLLAQHLFAIAEMVRGTVRYGKLDPYTAIFLRSTTVQKRYQNLQSHIYPTKEEAIAAVRRLEQQTNDR